MKNGTEKSASNEIKLYISTIVHKDLIVKDPMSGKQTQIALPKGAVGISFVYDDLDELKKFDGEDSNYISLLARAADSNTMTIEENTDEQSQEE